MTSSIGKIAQVIGPVVDVSFDVEKNDLPPIYTALKVSRPGSTDLMLEVEQHIGEQTVRCVAMDATDGLRRGMSVENLGQPIAVSNRRAGEGASSECDWSTHRPSSRLVRRKQAAYSPAGSEV